MTNKKGGFTNRLFILMIIIIVAILSVAFTLAAVKFHQIYNKEPKSLWISNKGENYEVAIQSLKSNFIQLKSLSSVNPNISSSTGNDHSAKIIERQSNNSLEYIDIRPFAPETNKPYVSYITADGKDVYACVRGGHLIHSGDEGLTWEVDQSIESDKLPEKNREIHLVAITDNKTIIAVGTINELKSKNIAVWRKQKNEKYFSRSILCNNPKGGPPASISIGKQGIVFTQYQSLNLFHSSDDGITWTKITFPSGKIFKNHVHCVWAHPSEPFVYVSGGDAGPKLGEKPTSSWDGLGGVIRSNDFKHWTKIYVEQPGERIVPVSGNQRRRFWGLESDSGGALATYDDEHYESIFGRQCSSYFNFNTLLYTPEGLLIAGTYQYRNKIHGGFGQAGEILISNDEGASFQRIRTFFSQVSALSYNSKYIYAGFGYGGCGAVIDDGPFILRFPKSLFLSNIQKEAIVTKIVFNKTDQTTQRVLVSGESTYQVNMSPFSKVKIVASVDSATTLTVQGWLYERDSAFSRDLERWKDLETITFEGPGSKIIILDYNASGFSIYRIKNTSLRNAIINQIAFVGIL